MATTHRTRRALLAAVVLAGVLAPAAAIAEPKDDRGGSREPESGQHYEGLRRNPDGPCGPNAFEFRTKTPGRGPDCTHGGDADGLAADGGSGGGAPNDPATVYSTPNNAYGQIKCMGDGSSGDRVQAIYVAVYKWTWSGGWFPKFTVVTDRYSSFSADLLQWAKNADGQFNQSASETSGERHIRFVTNNGDPGCAPVFNKVWLHESLVDNYYEIVGALRDQGYNLGNRKYLVWVDFDHPSYCGQGGIQNDDSSGSSNLNNNGDMFALVWCFNRSEGHELMHTLGGVQNSAPHASGGYHCTDEWDRMCYDDDGAGPVTMSYVCPSSHANLFDCSHDDYFHTSPAGGSYLATHWNAARNDFLVKCGWIWGWYVCW